MMRQVFLTDADIERFQEEKDLAAQWDAYKNTPKRWSIIRQAYSMQLPRIFEARKKRKLGKISPYFLDWWGMTPIEFNAWCDIRSLSLPLYPQFPVGRYFIDFADPVFKIGVELDGKAYHSPEKDEPRDLALWEKGWRIFRIPGCDSFASKTPAFTQEWDELRTNGYEDEAERLAHLWVSDKSEGFFWALKIFYYQRRLEHEKYLGAAYRALNARRLIDFPIELDSGDEEDGEGVA